MIGSLDESAAEATIVGAGVSGLLIAYALIRKGFKVKIYESQAEPGGLIRSQKTPYGLVESAAHSLWVTDAVKTLVTDLGVEMLPVRRGSQRRYVMRGGEAHRLPLGWFELSSALFKTATVSQEPSDLTLQRWGERHLGKAAVDYFLDPMVQGIYAATPDLLDLRATFPQWSSENGRPFLWHQLLKFKKRRRGKIMAPREGMSSLIQALFKAVDRYPGSSFHFNSSITDLDQMTGSKNVIFTTPANITGQIIGHRSVELSQMLKSITYSPLLTATVFIRNEDLPRSPQGLGILVPSKEKRKAMGLLMNSSAFDERVRHPMEHQSFTLFFGGSRFPEVVNLTDTKIHSLVMEELDYLLSFKTIPAHTEIVRWKRAIPLYNHDLRRTWQLAKQTWCQEKGRILFGNYTGQVSIRGMIEAVAKI